MSVVLLLWRTRLRSSWRSAIVLVVLIGLGGAVCLAVAAGARRTASANEAILETLHSSDVVTSTPKTDDPDGWIAELRALPDVSSAELWIGFVGILQSADPASIPSMLGFWSDDPSVDRPFITAGRFPTGPREAFLNEAAADRSGLGVGSKVQLALGEATFSDFTPIEVDIVGVGLYPDTVIEDQLTNKVALWFSRAFTQEHLDRMVYGSGRLTLRHGDVAAVKAGLDGRGTQTSTDGDNDLVIGEVRDQDRERVQKALRPLLSALGGLAVLAGVTTALVAAQALGRTLRRRRVDDQSLAAMGCTTRQLVVGDVAYATSTAACGIVLAVAVAVAASPLFPVGPTRRFDAVVGLHADLVVLGLGGSALLATIVGLVGAASWRRRARPGTPTPGRAPGLLGSRPASATGLRLVTGRRGALSTIVGVGTGLAVAVAALTFTGSLSHLVGNPRLVGMGWDVVAREGYSSIDVDRVRGMVSDDASVRRISGISYLDGTLNGVTTPVAVFQSIVGDPWPPIVAGRAPRVATEIVVGAATMRRLGLRLGDEVDISLASFNNANVQARAAGRFTVVGSAVTPAIGLAGIYTPRLDVGALLTEAGFREMSGRPSRVDVVLFDLDRRADAPASIRRFPEGVPDDSGNATQWYTSAVPAEVTQAEEARRVIWLAVVALVVAVVATIAHTLLGFVRQRRRDYAVLKALGFTRGQIRSTVLWQSGTVLAVALVVALPLGAAAGRWMWIGFAERIGVVSRPVVPLLLLGGAALLSILAVQGVALIPASIARRTPPGRTLHGE